jgi:flavin-dependent dehydrogenase
MQSVDVIVVGGGPAGSTCARRLVDGGAGVLVVDAARFPRDKVCAGWITPQVAEHLALDTAAYAEQHTYQPLQGFRVGWIGEDAAVAVEYARPIGAAIRRCEFDGYLLSRSGASVSQGTPVSTIRRHDRRWVVNERWSAPIVVGAAGYNCPVARALNGPSTTRTPLIVAREVEFVLSGQSLQDCAVESQVAELFFTADLAGYGWCVRKQHVMNVGLGRLDRQLTRAEVDAFARFVGRTRRFEVPPLERWRGHAYIAGAPAARKRRGDGLVLIGDAAGLASDKSGEGIGPAVESGLMAANVILEGGLSPDALSRYEVLVARRWSAPGALSRLTGLVPDGMTRPIARRLLRSPGFVRRVVLNRWFLHANESAA